MSSEPVRFTDGKSYEHFMGKWSQLAGAAFLKWLSPAKGWRWLDVGCGNGAFTELLVERCAPATVHGIDPSEGQLNYARKRPKTLDVQYQLGDAMALPFADDSFDAAVMPLVIFFVPEPSKGVAEMARVVQTGGSISAYAWDMPGGGFPYATLREAMEELGVEIALPPSPEASRVNVLHELWTAAGLHSVETRELIVERTFANFDDYWSAVEGGPNMNVKLKALSAETRTELKSLLRDRLPADATGRIMYGARANAVKGVC